MSTSLVGILSTVKPPRSENINHSTVAQAIESCPALYTFKSYDGLDPWQTGAFVALANLFDILSDIGREELMAEITEEDITFADTVLSENSEAVLRDLPKLAEFMDTEPTQFKAGVTCALTAAYVKAQDLDALGTPVEPEAPALAAPESGRETVDSGPAAETTPILPPGSVPIRPGMDLPTLLQALSGAGLDVESLNIVPRRNPSGMVTLVISGFIGTDVGFEKIAMINAIFKTVAKGNITVKVVRDNTGKEAVGYEFEA